MRVNLQKRSSTKSERRFSEILKRNHIPFQFRVKLYGKEIDFLIDYIAVEIGDHSQDTDKNRQLIESGYSILFISNRELRDSPSEVERHVLANWINNVKPRKSNTR